MRKLSTTEMCSGIRWEVMEFFEGDAEKTKLWLTTPNPQLGGISPHEMVKRGRLEKLYNFVKKSVGRELDD
jgi:hypothetical protein